MGNHADGERYKGYKRKEPTARASFLANDWDTIGELIEELTNNGWAIRFGRTRDGGCVAVGAYGDPEGPRTYYLRPSESLLELVVYINNQARESVKRYEYARKVLQEGQEGTETS